MIRRQVVYCEGRNCPRFGVVVAFTAPEVAPGVIMRPDYFCSACRRAMSVVQPVLDGPA